MIFFYPRSKVHNVASSILGVNCGVDGSLIKKKKTDYKEHFISQYNDLKQNKYVQL
jgi:hypothetical protein